MREETELRKAVADLARRVLGSGARLDKGQMQLWVLVLNTAERSGAFRSTLPGRLSAAWNSSHLILERDLSAEEFAALARQTEGIMARFS